MSWSGSVSAWLRLNPDQDLEPGYCDPIQIIGNDSKKGYIFLEWSKDDTPRYFRYAIRPLFPIWNPNNLPWHEIPRDKKPMVEVVRAPFSREKWTHVVFTLENINDKSKPPVGRLYLNGKLQGAIEKWDMTFDWDPTRVLLVLGASYVGHMDDLAVFDRPLTDVEVARIYEQAVPRVPNGKAVKTRLIFSGFLRRQQWRINGSKGIGGRSRYSRLSPERRGKPRERAGKFPPKCRGVERFSFARAPFLP